MGPKRISFFLRSDAEAGDSQVTPFLIPLWDIFNEGKGVVVK
jgi:hypothetical protein